MKKKAKLDKHKSKLLQNLRNRLKDELSDAEEFYNSQPSPEIGFKSALRVAFEHAVYNADDKGAELALKAFLWAGLGKGHSLALARLAKYYREGIGTELDLNLSHEFLLVAAKLGDTASQ